MEERQMEVTINYNGQAVAVEVTLEVYEFLDRADHKTENLFHLILTEKERYCMNFYMYSEDDENAQNVGIYKIEIALESEVAEDNFIWDNPPNGIFVGGQN